MAEGGCINVDTVDTPVLCSYKMISSQTWHMNMPQGNGETHDSPDAHVNILTNKGEEWSFLSVGPICWQKWRNQIPGNNMIINVSVVFTFTT